MKLVLETSSSNCANASPCLPSRRREPPYAGGPHVPILGGWASGRTVSSPSFFSLPLCLTSICFSTVQILGLPDASHPILGSSSFTQVGECNRREACTAFDNPDVALQNPEAAKLLAQMQAPAFSAEMDLQVGDLPWAGFKNRPG